MAWALFSAWEKTGLVELARVFHQAGIGLVATEGTANLLRNAHLPVREVSEWTGLPELFGGRLKSLHPKIHGGLLLPRGRAQDEMQAQAHGIEPIDYVVVRFYPFEEKARDGSLRLEQVIEYMDIGGPALVRSAAKNFRWVTVLVDPDDYRSVMDQVATMGATNLELRQRLAAKALALTSYYDAKISQYLREHSFRKEGPLWQKWALPLNKAQELRYGENPHQRAALYGDFWLHFQQLHGRELSYNNILDASSGIQLVQEFGSVPAIVIVKHTNPCGVGTGTTLVEAWEKAARTDPQALYGGVIISNQPVDGSLARILAPVFHELLVAPGFSPEALEILRRKKNLRLLLNQWSPPDTVSLEVRSAIANSYLVQESDSVTPKEEEFEVVSERSPSPEELQALRFAWKVVKHVKSNAIVFATSDRTLGIGAGQMARIDAVRIAAWKAREAGLSLEGSVVASDGFFPFPDGVIAAAEAGATAIVQPGGSIRDPDVLAAANARGLAMVFTRKRYFRH
ncbi:bifunctional phosphoribosylaminoimidazolecarboxamide formyltransferase/IMP cyclohydrolase [Candidatus Methylacidithermus pantelleriae]|uniref:Bifunctional purine biosynthesis protein PurH n=1 Tax=Candidatus Methylacidithermus pantelleriae TaxID=2744239 RepID=A0A8J2BSA7_9BACT|nr:bifunctional phosphoribosylaminoimidazolecarboxamide formyltransferase/IMP cyclohydrolase [Candidatus Methylacidithermus pantelleriae]CAF0694667.1 Phosphoribosylaminoimidazolecarboxamide formyltransferase / IMP cyclohydrolase [Candidatus Methylacidithermus pantelleriae]